jgi:DNA modification methylase
MLKMKPYFNTPSDFIDVQKPKVHTPRMSKTSPQYSMKAVKDLKANPRNARKHSDEQIDKIAKSLKEFRFINPVIINKKGEIIAGHGRVMAAEKLGMEEVPTILADHLTKKQQRAYMLADNRLAELAEWDDDLLTVELTELSQDFDLDDLGFDDAWFTSGHIKGMTDEDDVPTAPEEGKVISKPGDIWLLGESRVMCGNSTDKEAVGKLLGEEKPNLMVTDPPYGVEYDPSWREKYDKFERHSKGEVLNDDRADWTEAWELFPGNIAYVWHGDLHTAEVQISLENAGFSMRAQIIWRKQHFVFSRGDYHLQHEPCWYAVRKKGNWCGDRKQTTVWDIDNKNPMGGAEDDSNTRHGTQKPVECMRRPIVNCSKVNDVIYDPFLGSGTTIIAAETEGRVCYGMELNPAYVDIIVKR